MKKPDTKKIERFVNHGKITDESIDTLAFFQILVYLFIIGMSYNYVMSLLTLAPFIVLSLGIYLFFKKRRKMDGKNMNLLIGLEGMVLSLTCQWGCFLLIGSQKVPKTELLLWLMLLNLIMVGLMVLIAIYAVRAEKLYTATPVAVGPIVGGGFAGRNFLDRINDATGLGPIICMAGFSCVSSVFFICIMKYYYAKVLEKMEQTEKPSNDPEKERRRMDVKC